MPVNERLKLMVTCHKLWSFLDKPHFKVGLHGQLLTGILHRKKSFLGTPKVLSNYKAFICSLIEYWSPLWAASLPHILLSLTMCKPRPSIILESATMKLSLWDHHFTITDRSVISLPFTASFLVLHPVLFLCLIPSRFLQDTHGPPSTPFCWN